MDIDEIKDHQETEDDHIDVYREQELHKERIQELNSRDITTDVWLDVVDAATRREWSKQNDLQKNFGELGTVELVVDELMYSPESLFNHVDIEVDK